MSATRRALLVLTAALAAGLLWCGWQVVQTYRELATAADDAARLRDTALVGDAGAARAALDGLAASTASAEERTSGPTWDVLTRLPVVGDDARGVRTTAAVLADLSEDGLRPLTDSVSGLQSLAPVAGRVPVDRIGALNAPVSQAAAAFARADDRLRDQDSSGFTPRWQQRYRELGAEVSSARAALRTAETAVRLLPSMLGGEGRRRYLLVVQSNAEVRATGGLPGAVAVLQADDGQIRLVRQLSAASLGETAEPVLPLTDEELAVYGEQLGTWFLDANFTPDFPRAAELWRARFEQDGPRVDGVLSLDPVALGYLLTATGPVAAGGLTLTAENAAATLLNGVYLDVSDPAAQDAVFQDVARAVFDRVSAGVASPPALLTALGRAAAEGRLLVHSSVPEEQQLLEGRAVAGELPTGPGATPHVGVYLNDNTGSKMSWYLRTHASAQVLRCRDGVQTLRGSALLTSVAPRDQPLPDTVSGGGLYGFPPGDQLVAVRLYGPVGGTVSAVELDGEPLEPLQASTHEGRPVVTAFVYLKPGDGVELTWDSTTGPGQTGDVHVDVTPGLSGSADSVVPSAC